MNIKYNKFYYNPLPKEVYIKESKIHGHGIYALENLTENMELGATHIKVPMVQGFIRTPMGGFVNHSDNPNCYLEITRDWDDYLVYSLFTKQDIKKDVELVLEYGA